MNSSQTLIIPVEISVREFDAKLLLACAAAERGHRALLGWRTRIHNRVARLPRGIYFAKDFRKGSARVLRHMRELGSRVVAWDEEGLVGGSLPPSYYYERRTDPQAVAQVSGFFAWGPLDAERLKSAPGYAGAPIFQTGNPRFDILRGELRGVLEGQAEPIRRRHGDFILVNSNFPSSNHFLPAFRYSDVPADGSDCASFRDGQLRHRHALFTEFRKLVPDLARRFASRRIVIRPHPVENADLWREITASHPNVRVESSGSVGPWLVACGAMIHNGCTTATESAVLRVPTFAYQPIRCETHDWDLPNRVSTRCDSRESLYAGLDSALAADENCGSRPDCTGRLAGFVSALEGQLAVDRILDVIEVAGDSLDCDRPNFPKRIAAVSGATWRATKKILIKQRRADHLGNGDYQRHKWRGVSIPEVEAQVDAFRQQLGRFDGVRIQRFAPDIVSVRPS
jgi:surface carbohydrate biosynthesis protein